jgi:hypothetical protein
MEHSRSWYVPSRAAGCNTVIEPCRRLRNKRPSEAYKFVGFRAVTVTGSHTCTYLYTCGRHPHQDPPFNAFGAARRASDPGRSVVRAPQESPTTILGNRGVLKAQGEPTKPTLGNRGVSEPFGNNNKQTKQYWETLGYARPKDKHQKTKQTFWGILG